MLVETCINLRWNFFEFTEHNVCGSIIGKHWYSIVPTKNSNVATEATTTKTVTTATTTANEIIYNSQTFKTWIVEKWA